ncbi:putative transcription factor IBH1-like, bHLH domain-containing protein [Helianthus debilis subsp. tardiflorus]
MGDQDLHQTLGDLLEIKSKCNNNSSRNLLWKKLMEAQAKMAAKGGQKHHSHSATKKTRTTPTRNNTLKMIKRRRARRAGQGSSRRSTMIEKKVRTLKKLIPTGNSSVGLDGLFRDTAEYISNLQMRVSIMQAVVNALSNPE